MEKTRCGWATSALSIPYHDSEWGVPVHDDQRLFEMLTLEGAQAGLSWETILRKRENYRTAFADFDVAQVAQFTDTDIERLLLDPGIVRNRLKIQSTITNAREILRVQHAVGSLDWYLWSYVGGQPRCANRKSLADIPTHSPESDAMSKDLKLHGFRFVGTTICYSFMQAVGMVNDHVEGCFRRCIS